MCELIRKEIDSRKELENIEFLSFFFFLAFCISSLTINIDMRNIRTLLKNVEKKHKKKVD